MASQPEVTVIIPNYNGKKLLENCMLKNISLQKRNRKWKLM